GEVVAVGKAIMSGEEMIRATKGVAVRIRHRKKD
ncbi:MAG: pseudouridine synthase, partial [Methanobacteriaceae archaeon]|nr:pseudouridine synthase [Methanobacteriaceae archaeon]